jgi:DNA-binding MarR family transcriptional regulator
MNRGEAGVTDRTDADFGVIAERLGYQLRRLDMLAMNALFDSLAQIGVTPGRATSLVFISLHEGCDQNALARSLGINRASAMAAVNALVALGAVERRPGRDRRSNALHLTEAGRRLRDEVEQATAEHDAEIFGVLSDEERETLDRLIRKTRALNTPAGQRVPSPAGAIMRRIK